MFLMQAMEARSTSERTGMMAWFGFVMFLFEFKYWTSFVEALLALLAVGRVYRIVVDGAGCGTREAHGEKEHGVGVSLFRGMWKQGPGLFIEYRRAVAWPRCSCVVVV